MVIAHNPILQGFYPDPSICRVGEDFYIVNSSFVYAPGVPIFHSRDLAHWEQIGNILETESQLPVAGTEISRGIFAPTIRYHEGTYYMITTNVSHGGNFIVTATDPKGPWSEPYWLGEAAQGIDPSLFFDDDGRCYYCGTRPNPEGVRYNGDWEIYVQELDLAAMKLTGEPMAIWKGAVKGVIWPEGPHIYKIDGTYYLIHAEGGTGPEHAISVARSKELFHWFEGCPRNPIFTHRNLGKDYPVIYAGHGDLVDDGKGNWYIIMLASRPCQRHSSMGRETFLARVVWEDGWPVIAPGVGHLEDQVEIDLDEVRFPEEHTANDSIHFFGAKLDQRLMSIGDCNGKFYSLTDRPGMLRMYMKEETLAGLAPSAYLGLRQKSYTFKAGTLLDANLKESDVAGIALFQNHDNNLRIEVATDLDGQPLARVISHIHGEDKIITESRLMNCGNHQPTDVEELNSLDAVSSHVMVELLLSAENQKASVALREVGTFAGADEMAWKMIAEDISLLPYTTEEAGGFVGCTLGVYATSQGKPSTGYADIAYLNVENE